ncbi:MAG TPA: hypothetical protein VL021_08235 [Brumimicrobium sp.]|nr:hypothetical protein [Brumimicrobium sp.]
MKRILSFAVIGVFFAAIFSSCGSSKAKCDAYGYNMDTSIEQTSDLAQQ